MIKTNFTAYAQEVERIPTLSTQQGKREILPVAFGLLCEGLQSSGKLRLSNVAPQHSLSAQNNDKLVINIVVFNKQLCNCPYSSDCQWHRSGSSCTCHALRGLPNGESLCTNIMQSSPLSCRRYLQIMFSIS